MVVSEWLLAMVTLASLVAVGWWRVMSVFRIIIYSAAAESNEQIGALATDANAAAVPTSTARWLERAARVASQRKRRWARAPPSTPPQAHKSIVALLGYANERRCCDRWPRWTKDAM